MLQEFLEIEELKSIHEEKLRLMEREMALSTPLLTELEYIPMLYNGIVNCPVAVRKQEYRIPIRKDNFFSLSYFFILLLH